jgi:uncharacterized repeat protein (TIGR01451 family)
MLKSPPKSFRRCIHRSMLVAILCSPIFAVRSAQAATPIDCNSVYIDVNGSTQIYSVNTSTAIVTPTATLPLASAFGIAVLPGTPPTLYSDSTGTNHITSTNGTTTTNNTSATFTGYGGGMGADVSNRLFYFGSPNTAANTQTLYQFATPTSAAASIKTIGSTDLVWGQIRPGDMMSDGNGRLYYFGTIGGTGTVNYLFYVDSNNVAHRLGQYNGGVGIGVAFDSAGKIYTLDSTNLYKIDLTNGFSATLVGSTKTAANVTVPGIDMGSCALPVLNPDFSATDAIVKKVRNVTTGETLGATQNKASQNDILEYQITIKNSGNLPSDTTKFSDAIPTGTTYVAGSTKTYDSTGTTTTNPATAVADLTGGVAPFTAAATGTPPGATPATAAGMLVNTFGQFSGIVTAGAANAVVVKFQVKVTATNGIIPNAATVTYPKQAAAAGGIAGALTIASQTSNFAKTTLSIKVSGTVWNDLDLSGKSGTIFTTGELGTNASSTNFYAYLIDSTNKVIASSPISATGTYSFPSVPPNQTGLKIELSTTPPSSPLSSMTVPTPNLPTGWKNTAALTISPISTILADVPNEDFGIVQGANVILVKRVTGIKPVGASAWVRTTNPNELVSPTALNTVVHNPLDLANNDKNSNWPNTSYLVGAYDAGKIKPGDELEYTIYYLNTQGASASSLKICDPIRGRQTYTPGSMQLLPGGVSTPISLTDLATDTTIDRAYAYGAAVPTGLPTVVPPPDCNIGGTGYTVPTTDRDNGGLAIQLTGTGATKQPNLSAIQGATAAGTPTTSYGWFRFTTKVDR